MFFSCCIRRVWSFMTGVCADSCCGVLQFRSSFKMATALQFPANVSTLNNYNDLYPDWTQREVSTGVGSTNNYFNNLKRVSFAVERRVYSLIRSWMMQQKLNNHSHRAHYTQHIYISYIDTFCLCTIYSHLFIIVARLLVMTLLSTDRWIKAARADDEHCSTLNSVFVSSKSLRFTMKA